MIILAGITISMVVGNDGLIGKAELAKEEQSYKTTLEQVKIQCEYTSDGKVDLIKTKENIENLNNNQIKSIDIIRENNKDKLIVTFKNETQFTIDGSTENINQDEIKTEEDLKKYFCIEESGEVAKLTGLTEEGKKLKNIEIPKEYNLKKVTIIAEKSLQKSTAELIIIPETIVTIEKNAFTGLKVKNIIIKGNNLKTIGIGAFALDSELTNINIPDSVNDIGTTAFYWCSKLKSIKIPDGITSLGKNIFFYCTSLSELTLPSELEIIDTSAFAGCESLLTVNIDESNENFKVDNNILFSKDMTKIILYPAGKLNSEYNIPSTVNNIGEYAFFNAKNLEKVIIPDSVTTIGLSAFQCCNKLKEVKIPNNLNIIPNRGFAECTSLAKVIIPTSVKTIDYAAFYKCTALKNITIPNSVEKINSNAFYLCTDLLITVDRLESECDSYVSGWNGGNSVKYK